MSSSTETFQLSAEQAEIYESQFVPALFGEWAPWLADAAGVGPGQSVLDVACGTGIVARAAADRVGGTGSVTGVDINEGMLTVARRLRPDLQWHRGGAGDLPYRDETFDVVLCQAALMFFPDATQALREMGRVCRPGGVVGVQVWAGLESQPAYGPWVHMVAEHTGPEAVSLLSAYWTLGDLDVLRTRFETAGLEITAVHDHTGTVHFPSVEALVLTEISGTGLVDRMTDQTQARIVAESERVLGRFLTESGLEAPIAGHLAIARKA